MTTPQTFYAVLTEAQLSELIRRAMVFAERETGLREQDVANPLHPRPEVEDAPRDPQPARLTLGEP